MTTEVQKPENASEPETAKEVDNNNLSNTILASNKPKIIDLNNSMVNFNATFTVKSENGKPFSVIAVNETALDNADELKFKTAESGQISGQIFSDIDKPSNYILIIKTIEKDEEMNCTVDVTRTEIPAFSRTRRPIDGPPTKPPVQKNPRMPLPTTNQKSEVAKESDQKIQQPALENYVPEKQQSFFSKYKFYIIAIIAVLLCLVGYYLFFRNTPDKTKPIVSDVETPTAPITTTTPTPVPEKVTTEPPNHILEAINGFQMQG